MTTGWAAGHFAADRAAAEQVIATMPDVLVSVRAQRAFLGRAVHYLVAEAGIRQFLDIGTGLPAASNTHEVAQRAAPESRVTTWTTTRSCCCTPGRCWPAARRARPLTSRRICATPGRSWPRRPAGWISACGSR